MMPRPAILPIALYRLIVMVLVPAEEQSAAEDDKLDVAYIAKCWLVSESENKKYYNLALSAINH